MRVALCFLLVALASSARAETPAAHELPAPWSSGGRAGFLGPSPSTDDLAAHLRGTLILAGDGPGPRLERLGWRLGASATLWRWVELGATFSGTWTLAEARHAAGPVELWARGGPPSLAGVSVQAVLEHASGRGGFDSGGTIWPSNTTLGAVAGWQHRRLELTGSLAYQAAGEDLAQARYHGLQASLHAWATVIGGDWGLQLGGDVVYRIGGEHGAGALDSAWIFAAGARLVDQHGAAFGAAYGQGWGRGMPARYGAVRIGYSYGRGYVRPVSPLPPLLPLMEDWIRQRLQQLGAARPGLPPAVLPPLHLTAPTGHDPYRITPRPPAPPLLCQGPADQLPGQALRTCVLTYPELAPPPTGPVVQDAPPPPRPGHVAQVPPGRYPARVGPPPRRGGRGGGGGGRRAETQAERDFEDPETLVAGRLTEGPEGEPGPTGSWRPPVGAGPSIGQGGPVADPPESAASWGRIRDALRRPGTRPAEPPADPPEAATAAEHARPNYTQLPAPRTVAPARKMTPMQRREILDANARRNGGTIRDDQTGEELVRPQRHVRGVTPPPNEAQVDHRNPRSRGGTNGYDNAQVLSREHNIRKGARVEP